MSWDILIGKHLMQLAIVLPETLFYAFVTCTLATLFSPSHNN